MPLPPAYDADAPLRLRASVGDPDTVTASPKATSMRMSARGPCGPAPEPDVIETISGATPSTATLPVASSDPAAPGSGSPVSAWTPPGPVMLAPPGLSAPAHPYPRSADSSPGRAV